MRAFRKAFAVAGTFVLAAFAAAHAAAPQPQTSRQSVPILIGSPSGRGICDDLRPLDHDTREACVIAQTFCLLSRETLIAKARGEDIDQVIRNCVNRAVAQKRRSPRGSASEASPVRTDTVLLRRCLDSSSADIDGALRRCTAAATAPNASRYDRAMAYAARAFARLNRTPHDESGRAMADIDAAMRTDSNVGLAYMARGLLGANGGYLKQAIDDLDRAITLGIPTDDLGVAYELRGMQHQLMGLLNKDKREFALAAADFGQAIRLEPSAELYRQRSFAEKSLGQAEAARADEAAAEQLRSLRRK